MASETMVARTCLLLVSGCVCVVKQARILCSQHTHTSFKQMAISRPSLRPPQGGRGIPHIATYPCAKSNVFCVKTKKAPPLHLSQKNLAAYSLTVSRQWCFHVEGSCPPPLGCFLFVSSQGRSRSTTHTLHQCECPRINCYLGLRSPDKLEEYGQQS